MNALTPLTPAEPALSRRPCLHCAAALPPGATVYCCTGCEAAHALITGLGLDAFYARREAAAGELRPVPPPPPRFHHPGTAPARGRA
ncbi:heavy metal translocating P-type ATPase metal-binding domain-containing protein [Rhodovarius sp.]|uniref:heavy metal translocating P-type ATPase metal-binding domain-containing protein n=1 Tax=Rhodovarius sp. TaxID=2972673 RepID=UPI0034A125AB